MYRMLNAFMLLKPAMDVGNVPEFYTFFNSSATEVKRSWLGEGHVDQCHGQGKQKLYERH